MKSIKKVYDLYQKDIHRRALCNNVSGGDFMDLKQLGYFTAIVDEGSISAAAKKLHISQPPLSNQMKLLEAELGVVLFERGLRSITLTDAGELMYERANAILDMASADKMEIDSLGNGLRGTLRMGMVSSSVTGCVVQRMMAFRELYPEVNFQIYEGNTYQLLNGLKTNQIDLALVRAPFPETGFICHKYQEEYFVAAGLPGHLPEQTGLIGVAEHPLVLYRRWEASIRQVFEDKGLTIRLACMADNAWTSIQMARAGMGIALLPESFAADIPGIQIWNLKEEALKTQLVLVKRDDRYISNITKIFFEKFEV